MKTPFHSLVLGVAGVLVAAVTAQAGPALLGGKALAGQTLDADTVKAVLLGKRAMIGDNRVVIVVARTSDDQEAFLKSAVGMTTDQFQTYWRRLYMTGGGSAPKVVDTEAEACKLAAETAGAIAVGDSAKADGLVVLATK